MEEDAAEMEMEAPFCFQALFCGQLLLVLWRPVHGLRSEEVALHETLTKIECDVSRKSAHARVSPGRYLQETFEVISLSMASRQRLLHLPVECIVNMQCIMKIEIIRHYSLSQYNHHTLV